MKPGNYISRTHILITKCSSSESGSRIFGWFVGLPWGEPGREVLLTLSVSSVADPYKATEENEN